MPTAATATNRQGPGAHIPSEALERLLDDGAEDKVAARDLDPALALDHLEAQIVARQDSAEGLLQSPHSGVVARSRGHQKCVRAPLLLESPLELGQLDKGHKGQLLARPQAESTDS